MFRFQIRDLLWLTVVVAVALLFAIERHAHRKNREALNARNEQTAIQRDGLEWRLMHAEDFMKEAGYTLVCDDKHIQAVGPFPHGEESVTITRIKNGEAIKIMAGGKDVTRKYISGAPPVVAGKDDGKTDDN
jgi:hypothetical protein